VLFGVVTAVIALVIGVAVPAQAAIAPSAAAAAVAPTDRAAAGIVKAADLSQFTPGNIIDDAVFFNRDAMTEAQIQAFLQSKVPTCQSGYVCLKDWYDTSRTTSADAMCGAYAGGVRERASRIIYRVAQACGINPQVILATLQKEQGLVTHTWPSSWRYTIAMGQGCPDTAACDTRYYGFFNQVYGAAWQLKRYANPPGTSQYFTWYAPGKTWNILYNPNRACGSSPVYVQNQATANLYYYTPYQPNAAAIRAGYSTGDGCSSYGNRNFYNYFTDWFGSTKYTPTGAIAAEWNRLGGLTGSFGAPTGPAARVSVNGGGTVQEFQRGTIWHRTGSSLAYAMGTGPFRTNYLAAGGPGGAWGWPSGRAACGLVSAGCSMVFQFGTTYYTAAIGSLLVPRGLDAGYLALGGPAGAYGYPASAAQTAAAGSMQMFQKGGLSYSATTGTVPIGEPFRSVWLAFGGVTSSLGFPTAMPQPLAENGGGSVLELTKGTMWTSPKGTFAMGSGTFRSNYLNAGGPAGSWGWPASAATCGLVGGGCTMLFQNGTVAYSAATGSVLMAPAVATEWTRVNGASGIGYPKAAPTTVAANGGGSVQEFSKGTVWTSPKGTFAMGSGAFRSNYLNAGGPAGSWGWPASAATCGLVGGGCTMLFQNGTVAYSAATGSMLVPTVLATEWTRRGEPAGALGYPVAAASVVGNVTSQRFQGGTLSHDRATGAYR
jgi:uncharacterized protein with LGFP repeats